MPDGAAPRSPRRLSLYSLIPLLLAAVVALGWGFQHEALIKIIPGFPAMVPVTVQLIALVAIGLLVSRRVAFGLGVAVMALAALLLLEHFYHFSTGVLRLHPFSQAYVDRITNGARPATTTLTCFVCLGGSLALLGLDRPTRAGRLLPGALAAGVAAISWAILFAYAVWAAGIQDANFLAGIAVPTGAAILLLAIGEIQRSWTDLLAEDRPLAMQLWVLAGWLGLGSYVFVTLERTPVHPISNGGQLLLGVLFALGTATLVAMALVSAERARHAGAALREANAMLLARDAELSRSEELLRAARDGSLDAFFLLGPVRLADGAVHDFRLLDVNSQAERLAGRPRAALQSALLSDAFPVAQEMGFLDRYREVLATGVPFEEEFSTGGTRPGTRPRWIRLQAVRAGDGVALSVRDVTEARELEQQVRHAQRLDAAGRLASGVAHDFNNMLTVVLGTADELLADPIVRLDHARDIHAIRDAVERGRELTGRLLAFSRRQPSRREPCRLDQMVEGVIELARPALPAGIAARVVAGDSPATVEGDRLMLEQALMNLILNARDAMPDGGELTVTTDVLELQRPLRHPTGEVAPGRWARVEVRDSGTGMAPEVAEHAFEPFFTTKPTGRGSGLGLSTAYGIVRQAGGHLFVAETGQDGTAVQLYLPVVPVMPETGLPGGAGGLASPGSPIGGPVLVVDDDPQVRDVVSRLLRRIGCEVELASDGVEALAALSRGGFRLLVTDMVMPRMGGAELARRARGLDPAIAVVYISGYTEDEVALRGSERPGECFLAKPFTTEELMQAVQCSLDGVRTD